MEKLEAALAKAREARKASGAHESTEFSRPGVHRVMADWTVLDQITVTQDQARLMRLAALTGGRDATPYDMLRSRTLRIMRDAGWKRLAITSPNAACGKSTLALNLSLALARQQDLRILLMDLDLRRPSLHRLCGHQPKRSLHEVLDGSAPFEDAAVRIGGNLIVAMNAAPSRSPAELLHSEKGLEMLRRIEKEWQPDLTIFDMSPMLASDDNVGFLGNTDCALLVVAAESTTLPNIDVCEKELAQLTNVLGIVLNKCRYEDASAGYGYEAYD